MLIDFECPACNSVVEKLLFSDELDSPYYCKKCGYLLERLFPRTMNFKLKYDNKKDSCGWACDSYSSSRYWDDHKKGK